MFCLESRCTLVSKEFNLHMQVGSSKQLPCGLGIEECSLVFQQGFDGSITIP